MTDSPALCACGLQESFGYYQKCSGHGSDAKQLAAFDKYGPNRFDVPLPAFSGLLLEHMLAPFFCFQVPGAHAGMHARGTTIHGMHAANTHPHLHDARGRSRPGAAVHAAALHASIRMHAELCSMPRFAFRRIHRVQVVPFFFRQWLVLSLEDTLCVVPFCCHLQVFCVLLWCLDDYWYYSLFTLFMLVTFECTVVGQRLRNLKELRTLQTPKQETYVYRCGKWEKMPGDALLPGDVISIGRPSGGGWVTGRVGGGGARVTPYTPSVWATAATLMGTGVRFDPAPLLACVPASLHPCICM